MSPPRRSWPEESQAGLTFCLVVTKLLYLPQLSHHRLLTVLFRHICTVNSFMRLRRKDGTFTSRGIALRNWRHGEAVGNKLSPEYTAFRAAQKRCRWKGDSSFANYGGRGIKFLFHSFTQFLKEIGRKP